MDPTGHAAGDWWDPRTYASAAAAKGFGQEVWDQGSSSRDFTMPGFAIASRAMERTQERMEASGGKLPTVREFVEDNAAAVGDWAVSVGDQATSGGLNAGLKAHREGKEPAQICVEAVTASGNGLVDATLPISEVKALRDEKASGWEKARAIATGVTKVAMLAATAVGIVKGGPGKVRPSEPPEVPRGGTYKLKEAESGTVRRTGRAKDLSRRQRQHARAAETKDLDFEVDRRTDNYSEQRGREHAIHEEHPEARHPKHPEGGTPEGLNKARAIAPDNPNRDAYIEAAKKIE